MTRVKEMTDRELSEAVCNAKNIRELNRLEAEQARRLNRDLLAVAQEIANDPKVDLVHPERRMRLYAAINKAESVANNAITMPQDWESYDAAAEWCAKHGFTGKIGDPLPNLMPKKTVALINADPEAFADRVRLTAYALAMSGRKPSGDGSGPPAESSSSLDARS